MADAMGEQERAKEKELWRRFAFLAAEVVNISGKSVRRPVKAKDLVRFEDENDKAPHKWTPAEIEVRKRQAMETAKLHKSKFWAQISDGSVQKIIGNDNE